MPQTEAVVPSTTCCWELSGRKRKTKESGKRDRGRIIGVFVATETRSHGGVKGKHFADDGNTEEYC